MMLQAIYAQIADYKEQIDEAQGKLEAAEQAALDKQAELEAQLQEQQAASATSKSEHDATTRALQQQLDDYHTASNVGCLSILASP